VAVMLELVGGTSVGTAIAVQPGEVIEIGRTTPVGGGVLSDRHMSVRHFLIVCEQDQCRIRDLGSTNGTFVNGVKVSEAKLHEGDRIEAGSSTFVVRLDRVPPRAGGETSSPAVVSSGSWTVRSERAVPLLAARPLGGDVRAAATSVSGHDQERPGLSSIPFLDITNPSSFKVATLAWEDREERARLTILVKATLTCSSSVGLAREQLPIFAADVLSDVPSPSVRFEADRVPFKPRTDIVLVGRAYAPGGTPVTQLMAGLRVGRLGYGAIVFGDRVWQWQTLGAPTISAPQPFTSKELVYERAFGGIDGPGGMYCNENLVGTGFIGKKTRERIDGLRLPNLEDPRNPIHTWDSRPTPVGFGFYGRGWMPRLAYAGTYDDKYRAERAPAMPDDFSYAFFNGAHPALQVEGYLRGDEDVVLLNVCPHDPEMRFRLPGIMPRITVSRWTVPPDEWIEEHLGPDGGLRADLPLMDEIVQPVLDTLVFLPDEGIFYEVFRGVCALSSLDSIEIARIAVTV
jgi:hypothetical protein